MIQKKNIYLEFGKLDPALVIKKEIEAKESVEKEINDITLSDVQHIIKILNNPSIPYFLDEKINYKYIFLFHKLKYICFKKGIPTCFLLIDQKALVFIYSINIEEKYKNCTILNTNELMNFVFLKIFRLGEANALYLKDEILFLNLCKNLRIKIDKDILNQPMKQPETDLEKLFALYMSLMNTDWNNDKYFKFIELYKQLKPKFDNFTNDFCNIIIRLVQQNQKEYLYKSKDIDYENIPLKDRTFFKENEIIKSDGENNIFNEMINKNSLKENICSFLNCEGGRIYIGINQDKQILGVDFIDSKERDNVNQDLYNLVKDFYPSVRKGEIKIYFIPIKNNKNQFIKGLYIIKIIVPQGNVNELYSIEQNQYQSYIRENGETKKLDCDMIEKEIITRTNKEKKIIDNNIFNDKEPEQPVFPKINIPKIGKDKKKKNI